MSNDDQFVAYLKAIESTPPDSTIEPLSVLAAGRRRRFTRGAGVAALPLAVVTGLYTGVAALPDPSTPAPPATTLNPHPSLSASESSDAQAQAQAWLDAATLPPGAVPSDASVAAFSSYTAWPCGPVAELEAFWSLPGWTVSETANWLRGNPTGALIPTGFGPVPDNPAFQSASVGFIPTEGAQEGIVYTVEKTPDGVAVRAEVAAQTATASCPELPDGGVYGAPGEG